MFMVYNMFILLLNNCLVLISCCFIGEQEVRVLTLAEQIIAAMPERIKVIDLFIINVNHLYVIITN